MVSHTICQVSRKIFCPLSWNPIKSMKFGTKLSDPVDKKRNILSSVGNAKFNILKKASSSYLDNPNAMYFFPNQVKPLKRIKDVSNLYLVKFKKPELVEDAVWGTIKRKVRKFERNAQKNGFTVKKSSVLIGGKALAFLRVETKKRIFNV